MDGRTDTCRAASPLAVADATGAADVTSDPPVVGFEPPMEETPPMCLPLNPLGDRQYDSWCLNRQPSLDEHTSHRCLSCAHSVSSSLHNWLRDCGVHQIAIPHRKRRGRSDILREAIGADEQETCQAEDLREGRKKHGW